MNIIHHKGYQVPFDQFNICMNEEQISVISSHNIHNIYQLHGIESFQNRHSVDGLGGWLQT